MFFSTKLNPQWKMRHKISHRWTEKELRHYRLLTAMLVLRSRLQLCSCPCLNKIGSTRWVWCHNPQIHSQNVCAGYSHLRVESWREISAPANNMSPHTLKTWTFSHKRPHESVISERPSCETLTSSEIVGDRWTATSLGVRHLCAETTSSSTRPHRCSSLPSLAKRAEWTSHPLHWVHVLQQVVIKVLTAHDRQVNFDIVTFFAWFVILMDVKSSILSGDPHYLQATVLRNLQPACFTFGLWTQVPQCNQLNQPLIVWPTESPRRLVTLVLGIASVFTRQNDVSASCDQLLPLCRWEGETE